MSLNRQRGDKNALMHGKAIGYQPYKGYLGSFKFPEVGAMVQEGFSDLFENHHFNIGYRMPSGMEGSDFLFRYGNTKRKLDWHFMYFLFSLLLTICLIIIFSLSWALVLPLSLIQ